ncbi:MAG: hypothetical protein Q9214_003978, partial [Letrouitia sp. 1 TL-2023]
CRKIAFLFAYHDLHGDVHFLSQSWPLPPQASYLEELGEYLAVDPKSRAMAVAGYENTLTLYSLKSMEQMRHEVEMEENLRHDAFMPIKGEKHFKVEGTILKMEFLHPPKDDTNHVNLLLIVSKNGKSRLLLYEWDFLLDIRRAELKGNGLPIEPDDQLPLLLIPLTFAAAFVLVSERRVTVYRDILSGSAKSHVHHALHDESPEPAPSSGRWPIWTQWARPMRSEHYGGTRDQIFLCREDGVVQFILINEKKQGMFDSNHRAGILKVNINTAFATIDLGSGVYDLLVAGGDMCDGGSWAFLPRMDFPYGFTKFSNWTPIADVEMANDVKSDTSECYTTAYRQRLFACTGRGSKNGSVTEFRYGTLASKIGATVDLGDAASKGVLDMWALPVSSWSGDGDDAEGTEKGVLLLISHVNDTELVFLPSAEDADPYSITQDIGFDVNTRTIAAGSTDADFLIQVTSRMIRAMSLEGSARPYASSIRQENIVAACIQRIPNKTTLLLTIVHNEQGFQLHQGHIGIENKCITYEKLGETIDLSSEPTCVSIRWISDRIFAFVGTVNGTLQIYNAEPGASLSPQYEHLFGDEYAVCDSIAAITSRNNVQLIICGLRNGEVQVLKSTTDDLGRFIDIQILRVYSKCVPLGATTVVIWDRLEIGTMAVRVTNDTTKASRVIISCDQTMYSLEYSAQFALRPPATVNKVWIMDPNSPEFFQGQLSCFTQADFGTSRDCSDFHTGSVFYLRETQLFIASLSKESQPRMVPRRLPIKGTPTRVVFSDRLKRLIIIYNKTTSSLNNLQDDGRRNVPRPRMLQSRIACVDPDQEHNEGDSDAREDHYVPAIKEETLGERFLGILEWFPSDNRNEYHILVIHSMIERLRSPSHESKGRLLLLSPTTNEAGKIKFHEKKAIELEAPVWTVASFGSSSLVYACGNDLVMQTLDMGTKKFHQQIRTSMRSRGNYISVYGSYIYVSTAAQSLSIYTIEDQKFSLQFSDSIERPSIYHLYDPKRSVILASDMSNRLAGLWQPPQVRMDRSAPTVFEANLPASITRLCRISRPPWLQRHQRFSDHVREAFIGSSVDGTIYQFVLLDKPSWMLLRFVQNMMMRNRVVCPFPRHDIYERHLEPDEKKKHQMQIDGDILGRFLDRGGESLLQEMLYEQPNTNHKLVDFHTAADRQARFWDLVRGAIGESPDKGPAVVIDWMRVLLLPAL